jgi:DNA-binding MarR family transcriptional regulator
MLDLLKLCGNLYPRWLMVSSSLSYPALVEMPTERVVELLLRLMDGLGSHLGSIASAHDLTPIQAKVLWILDQPRPMRVIADKLHCDASNVTGIIDRLESRGLVERQSAPADRRVKQVVRTPSGADLAGRLSKEAHAEIPLLSRLDADEMAAFVALLERMVPDEVPAAAAR